MANPEKKVEKGASTQQNEGEGSRSAARRYNQGVKETVESGQVDELAKEAEDALESDEGAELREAEREGKSRKA